MKNFFFKFKKGVTSGPREGYCQECETNTDCPQ